jgi:hypothetical protein
MKRRLFVAIFASALFLVAPVLPACDYWDCQTGDSFAHCYLAFYQTANYFVDCAEYHQCMPGGGCVYYCRYVTQCYSI